ncbi:MAG: hypothetical protein ABSA42_03465 [Terracidiphilus sp.]|jgi:hypothetical protein
MKDLWSLKSWVIFAACFTLCGALLSQEPGCLEISRMAAMARAKTPAALKASKEKAGDSYRAQLIFAARMLEIDPRNKTAAESLLNLLPKDEFGPEQTAWLDLAQLEQCPSGGPYVGESKPLDVLEYHLPRLAARAVLLAPDKMFDYVSYAQFSVTPESDYAVQMRKVCMARHQQFVDAANRLPPKDKSWFVSKIFNPDGCRTIAFPEQ